MLSLSGVCAKLPPHVSPQILAFFAYLLLGRQYDFIEIHYMVAGHTKFSCDQAFSVCSHRMRRKDVHNVASLASLLHSPPRYATHVLQENESYRWKNFFTLRFSKVNKIKSYHSFYMERSGDHVALRGRRECDEHPRDVRFYYMRPFKRNDMVEFLELGPIEQEVLDSLKSIAAVMQWQDVDFV